LNSGTLCASIYSEAANLSTIKFITNFGHTSASVICFSGLIANSDHEQANFINNSVLEGIFVLLETQTGFTACVFLQNTGPLTNREKRPPENPNGILLSRCIFDTPEANFSGYAIGIYKNCLFNRTSRTPIPMKHMDTWGCPGVPLDESLKTLTSGLWIVILGGGILFAWSVWLRWKPVNKND
jgi:hypothetical protein